MHSNCQKEHDRDQARIQVPSLWLEAMGQRRRKRLESNDADETTEQKPPLHPPRVIARSAMARGDVCEPNWQEAYQSYDHAHEKPAIHCRGEEDAHVTEQAPKAGE